MTTESLAVKKISLMNGILMILGVFLIVYPGLYYCGWEAIVNLIAYAGCDWDCIEYTEIAWAVFRLTILMEFFVLAGIVILIFSIE